MGTITISNLSKKYNNRVILNNINLNIHGVYGLLGPNGAGKTTLMKIIATLIEQDKGTISFENTIWKNKGDVRRIIGYLPQKFSIYPSITVLECLNHFAILKGIKDKQEREKIIKDLLFKTNLSDVKFKKMKELSGGMLRRVGIAQTLIGNPKIIIVDEPTTGLDIEERVRFRNLVRDIGKDRIVIISTHIVGDLENICENICVMKEGSILAEGTYQDICSYAKDRYWEVILDEGQLGDFLQKFHVISTNHYNNQVIVKVLSEVRPTDSAKVIPPDLEVGYLSLVKGNN